MIRGAMFDMDGTLIDSMKMWRSLADRYLRSLGIEPAEDLREKNKKRTFQGLVEELKEGYGLEKTEQEIADGMMQQVAQFYRNEVERKDGVIEFLRQLQRQGVRMCIVTATDRKLAMIALERCGLTPYFSRMFTCSEVGRGKNDPLIFRQALDWLGTGREETLVFEDAYYAIDTAVKDGFRTVAVYDRFEPRQCEIRERAELCLSSWEDQALLQRIL